MMAAPAVLMASFVVLGGLLTAAAQSLGLLPLTGSPSLTLGAYTAVAPDLPAAIGLSLAIAAASTMAASVVGFTAALIIVQGRWCGRVVAAVSTLTIPIPHIVGAASVRLRRLRHVLVPLSLPALTVSATIVFVYTFGSYEVAWLLGRPYPEPLPVMALRVFGSASLTSRPEAAALAMVTTVVSFGAATAAFALLRRIPLWR